MHGFNSPNYSEVEHDGRENLFRLEGALVFSYTISIDGREKRIISIRVPKGFETNFLSIPWYRRLPLYYAVRIFGGLSRVTKDDIERAKNNE